MIERTPEETQQLKNFRERVLRRNPYKLDKWGILNVPELGPIPLAGLTAEEATQRLSAELRLAEFHRPGHAPAAEADRHRGAEAVRL